VARLTVQTTRTTGVFVLNPKSVYVNVQIVKFCQYITLLATCTVVTLARNLGPGRAGWKLEWPTRPAKARERRDEREPRNTPQAGDDMKCF
jgi:hypothetical protein